MNNKKCIALMPLRCILSVICFVSLSLIFSTSLQELSKWWSIIASGLNIITILIIMWVCKHNNITFKELLNIKKENIKIKNILAIVAIAVVVGMGGMYVVECICYGKFPDITLMMVQPIPVILAVLNIFILPITTTLAEDGLYLGVGMNKIEGKWKSILIPIFFYALQHSFIPVLPDVKFMLYRFLSFLPLIILFSYLYYKKRNIVPIMTAHFVLNIITVVQITLMSVSPAFVEMMSSM